MPLTQRKFGIEMEGYISRHPRNLDLPHGASAKRDASLRNSGWEGGGFGGGQSEYGVEIVSTPTRNTDHIEAIFQEMQRKGWHVDDRAGTHVHVDIADHSGFDKAKLLRFCKGIERIIHMFVKNYRNNNRYCKHLSEDWRKIFKPIKVKNERSSGSFKYVLDGSGRRRKVYSGGTPRKQQKQRIDLTNVPSNGLIDRINRTGLSVENSKYFWLNIYGSRHNTAEFRIFHAVENWNEIKYFILMAHNIVELVKNSTVEQLEFIILNLYSSANVDELRNNFFQLLNIQGARLPFAGGQAKVYMETKLNPSVAAPTPQRAARSSMPTGSRVIGSGSTRTAAGRPRHDIAHEYQSTWETASNDDFFRTTLNRRDEVVDTERLTRDLDYEIARLTSLMRRDD